MTSQKPKIKDLKEGDILIFSDREWFYLGEGDFLLLEPISAIYDAAEISRPTTDEHDIKRQYGNNDYTTSNIHQWLNSDKEDWFEPTHGYDCLPKNPPTPFKKGFLCGFTDEEKSHLVLTERTYSETGEVFDCFAYIPELASIRGKNIPIKNWVMTSSLGEDPAQIYALNLLDNRQELRDAFNLNSFHPVISLADNTSLNYEGENYYSFASKSKKQFVTDKAFAKLLQIN